MYSSRVVIFTFLLSISQQLTISCPKECFCNEMTKTVLCSDQYLQEIPQNIPDYTEQLLLSSNQIRRIKKQDLSGLTNLRKLQLQKNKISQIEDGSFEDLGNLTELYMSENMILRLRFQTFEGLVNLNTLWLKSFHPTSVSPCVENGAFAAMKNLKTLLLSENDFLFLSDTVFVGLNKLTDLHISLNRINKISEKAFLGLPSNTNVYFGAENSAVICCCSTARAISTYFINRVTSCTVQACFDGNPVCKTESIGTCTDEKYLSTTEKPIPTTTTTTISIKTEQPPETTSDQKLTATTPHQTNPPETPDPQTTTTEEPIPMQPATLPPVGVCPDRCSCYHDIKSVSCNGLQLSRIPNNIPADVKKLTLSGNSISRVRRYDFFGLTNLVELQIHSNNIESIDDGSFDSLGNLTSLYLNHNNLRRISRKTFSGLNDLKILYLMNVDKSGETLVIEDGAFSMLQNLEILQIQFNRFLYFSDKLFSGLENLDIFSFSSELVSVISENAFAPFKKTLTYSFGKGDFQICCCRTAKALFSISHTESTQCKISNCTSDNEMCSRYYTSTGTWSLTSPLPSTISPSPTTTMISEQSIQDKSDEGFGAASSTSSNKNLHKNSEIRQMIQSSRMQIQFSSSYQEFVIGRETSIDSERRQSGFLEPFSTETLEATSSTNDIKETNQAATKKVNLSPSPSIMQHAKSSIVDTKQPNMLLENRNSGKLLKQAAIINLSCLLLYLVII